MVRLVPLVIFVLLLTLTLLVTRGEFQQRRAMQARHTEDVTLQASRRLEIFVDSRLRVAEIFARRWATHEERDFSRDRFEEFGSVILEAIPGYRALALVSPDRSETWVIPGGVELAGSRAAGEYDRVLDEAGRTGETVLSPPIEAGAEGHLFFAALPLHRGGEPLGSLVVLFQADALIDDCFHHRIRREFDFEIRDGDRVIYRFAPDGRDEDPLVPQLRASRTFEVRNRRWVLTMAPRQPADMMSRLGAAVPVFLLGLLLSVGLTWLVHLLQIRLQLYREARDRAMSEMSAREAAQEALTVSEARYRGVFHSVTDGLVILNREGVILEANEAACAMHGRPPGALELAPLTTLLPTEGRRLWEDLQRQLDERGAARLDARHGRSDGEMIEVEVRAVPLTQEAEGRVLVILSDVTERIRSERRHAQLSRKVLVAQEEERGRISRELHDELGQLLTALRLELGWLGKRAELSGDQRAAFEGCIELVETAAEQLRHTCKGLRPPLLDDLGLEPAVQLLVDDFTERTGIEVDYHVDLDEAETPLPPEVALCAYRILQESLTNVGRHAGAEQVMISLVRRRGRLVASVYDDGRGFDVDGLSVRQGGCGIAGMRERAKLVGGEVEIRSVVGEGTRVAFEAHLGG